MCSHPFKSTLFYLKIRDVVNVNPFYIYFMSEELRDKVHTNASNSGILLIVYNCTMIIFSRR